MVSFLHLLEILTIYRTCFRHFVSYLSAEIDLYLTDTSTDIESLCKFSADKSLCLRYNTALFSSAPVDRLFSLGGQIYSKVYSL